MKRTIMAIVAAGITSGLLALPSDQWDAQALPTAAHNVTIYRGETYTFAPRLMVSGVAYAVPTNATVTLYWSTNNWATAPYGTNGTVTGGTDTGRVSVAWNNDCDVGANSYAYFIGIQETGGLLYRLRGTITMLPSPNWNPSTATPQVINNYPTCAQVTGIVTTAIAAHVSASDPHGDRAYTDAATNRCVQTNDTRYLLALTNFTDLIHGARGGANLHALADGSEAGFLSALQYGQVASMAGRSNAWEAAVQHTNRTDNPHSVTAAQVGAISNNGVRINNIPLGNGSNLTITGGSGLTNVTFAAGLNITLNGGAAPVLLTDNSTVTIAASGAGGGGGGISNVVVNGNTGVLTGSGSNIVSTVTLVASDVGAVATNDARYLAALTNAAQFATAAQGSKADTAVQPAALTAYVQTNDTRYLLALTNNQTDVTLSGSFTATGGNVLTNAAAFVSTNDASYISSNSIGALEFRAASRSPTGLVTFVFDDGYASVYTYLKPVFDSLSAVACESIVSDWVGSTVPDGIQKMTWSELRTLQSNGWEIVAHSRTHADFSTSSVSRIQFELGDKEIAATNGITMKNFVWPYGYYNQTSANEVWKKYRSARGATGNLLDLNGNVLNTYNLAAAYLNDYSETNITNLHNTILSAKTNNQWMIIYTHSGDTPTAVVVSNLIVWIQGHNIQIVTINEALDKLGNTLDAGVLNNRLSVGANGSAHVSSNLTVGGKIISPAIDKSLSITTAGGDAYLSLKDYATAFKIDAANGFTYFESGKELSYGSSAPLLFTGMHGYPMWMKIDTNAMVSVYGDMTVTGNIIGGNVVTNGGSGASLTGITAAQVGAVSNTPAGIAAAGGVIQNNPTPVTLGTNLTVAGSLTVSNSAFFYDLTVGPTYFANDGSIYCYGAHSIYAPAGFEWQYWTGSEVWNAFYYTTSGDIANVFIPHGSLSISSNLTVGGQIIGGGVVPTNFTITVDGTTKTYPDLNFTTAAAGGVTFEQATNIAVAVMSLAPIRITDARFYLAGLSNVAQSVRAKFSVSQKSNNRCTDLVFLYTNQLYFSCTTTVAGAADTYTNVVADASGFIVNDMYNKPDASSATWQTCSNASGTVVSWNCSNMVTTAVGTTISRVNRFRVPDYYDATGGSNIFCNLSFYTATTQTVAYSVTYWSRTNFYTVTGSQVVTNSNAITIPYVR